MSTFHHLFARRTHIDTLADDTPKSRRRVRRTLGLAEGGPIFDYYVEAQAIARRRETAQARKVVDTRRANRAQSTVSLA